jgi:hypothetical protein
MLCSPDLQLGCTCSLPSFLGAGKNWCLAWCLLIVRAEKCFPAEELQLCCYLRFFRLYFHLAMYFSLHWPDLRSVSYVSPIQLLICPSIPCFLKVGIYGIFIFLDIVHSSIPCLQIRGAANDGALLVGSPCHVDHFLWFCNIDWQCNVSWLDHKLSYFHDCIFLFRKQNIICLGNKVILIGSAMSLIL